MMNDLVEILNGQAITTSLKVAEVFEKEHNFVMRAIRNLENDCEDVCNFAQMFSLATYVDKYGRQQPMYQMTRKGFTMVGMRFTGKNALKFQNDFYDAFEAMENKIKELVAERESEQWMVVRQSTKITQRKVTDAIKEYVIPNARANGSETPNNVFYMSYNKLFNKVAKVPAGQRDNLSVSNLIMLDQRQSVAAANIRLQAESGASYKEIFSGTKNAVEGYAQIALVTERLLLN